ncbi:MAG: hypothetical protein H7144_08290 [Burkholderiales bacterium]|nr:hypothetical protein [Phycisphaerae bacterium]
MKLLHFDLMVVAPAIEDLSIPMFVRQMRTIAPWLKWVLAGPGITSQLELAARANGALAVIDDLADWSELETLVATVRQRSGRSSLAEA